MCITGESGVCFYGDNIMAWHVQKYNHRPHAVKLAATISCFCTKMAAENKKLHFHEIFYKNPGVGAEWM